VSTMTAEAFLAELLKIRELPESGDPGRTVPELMEAAGVVNPKRIREWLAREITAGRVVQGWRPKKGIDGRNTRTPVYRAKEQP
jgi:hypothetical protein